MTKEKVIKYLAYAFIVSGLLLNVWTLGLFSSGGFVITTQLVIWAFDIGCILTGIILLKYRNKVNGKEILFSLIPLLIFLLLIEGSLRIYFSLKKDPTNEAQSFSDHFGWVTNPDQSFSTKIEGFDESKVTIGKNGFRRWGDVHSPKKKLMVIGDSYTLGLMVSDGDCYYDVLKKQMPGWEFFTYGCGGYGTLQEYMILDKFIDTIKPDAILFQFCSNDFVDNSFELESQSFTHNNHKVRPYYINGKIEYKYPSLQMEWLMKILEKSYLLKIMNINTDAIIAKKIGSIEEKLTPSNPLMVQSMKITNELLVKCKTRANGIPLFAFAVDKPQWVGNSFSELCKRNSIEFIAGVPEAIDSARSNGIVVDGMPHDAHWNGRGHKIAGDILGAEFINY